MNTIKRLIVKCRIHMSPKRLQDDRRAIRRLERKISLLQTLEIKLREVKTPEQLSEWEIEFGKFKTRYSK